jgi:hypothetical protein
MMLVDADDAITLITLTLTLVIFMRDREVQYSTGRYGIIHILRSIWFWF